MIPDHQHVDVFVGLDVSKCDHHAVALDRAGKVLYDRALPDDEAKLRAILADLATRGQVLVVVDQPATIGALPVAVARDAGAPGGIPARAVDAPDRGSAPRQRQDRRP